MVPSTAGYLGGVDVISHAAGIAWPGADDGNVLEKWREMKPVGHQYFACVWSLAAPLYMMLLGKNIYIFPVHVGRFGYFQLFQVA